jgi:hypothetical protein
MGAKICSLLLYFYFYNDVDVEVSMIGCSPDNLQESTQVIYACVHDRITSIPFLRVLFGYFLTPLSLTAAASPPPDLPSVHSPSESHRGPALHFICPNPKYHTATTHHSSPPPCPRLYTFQNPHTDYPPTENSQPLSPNISCCRIPDTAPC